MDFIRLFKKHWYYSRPEQWRVVYYFFWHSVSVAGSLTKPYAFAMVLNNLQAGLLSKAKQWIIWYVVGFTVFELGHRIARSTERYLAFRNRKRFVLLAYDRLHGFPLSWHNDHHSANVIDRINKAADALYNFGESQYNYIDVTVNFIGSFAFLWLLSPWIAIVGCVIGILSMSITRWLYKISVPEYRAQNELFHKLAAALMDYISNITTIIVLRLGKRARKDLENRNDEVFPHLVKEHFITQVKCFLNAFLVIALNVSIMIFFIHLQSVDEIGIKVGSIVAIFQYLDLLMNTFGYYSGDYEKVIHWWQDYNAATMIFETDLSSLSNLQINTKPISDTWKTITVGVFDFSYGSGCAKLHCDPIHLERGKKIAFIGDSGAGKSTCLHILRGMFPVDGMFTLDGKEKHPIGNLGQITTLVSQEPEILENTILYNITLGVFAEFEEIKEAAHIACFDEVVKSLPEGYNSDIREKGVNLSGGEKQRLALARGVFAMGDSSLILLDEPTGSLDATTEAVVYQRLFDAFTDACIVSTLHRLHLLPMFDYIYVFCDGYIVESGTFESLKVADGKMSMMWNQYHVTK